MILISLLAFVFGGPDTLGDARLVGRVRSLDMPESLMYCE